MFHKKSSYKIREVGCLSRPINEVMLIFSTLLVSPLAATPICRQNRIGKCVACIWYLFRQQIGTRAWLSILTTNRYCCQRCIRMEQLENGSHEGKTKRPNFGETGGWSWSARLIPTNFICSTTAVVRVGAFVLQTCISMPRNWAYAYTCKSWLSVFIVPTITTLLDYNSILCMLKTPTLRSSSHAPMPKDSARKHRHEREFWPRCPRVACLYSRMDSTGNSAKFIAHIV